MVCYGSKRRDVEHLINFEIDENLKLFKHDNIEDHDSLIGELEIYEKNFAFKILPFQSVPNYQIRGTINTTIDGFENIK